MSGNLSHVLALDNVQADEPSVIHARFLSKKENTPSLAFSLDIDVKLPGSGITAIYGHSGSGKTSLLRCIAGLQKETKGELTVNGTQWQSDSFSLPTHKRPLGYVFQEASLLPHLTAQGNLDYANKRSDNKLDQNLYKQIIEILGIAKILPQYPEQLSGGERQRVAIARALLINPKLLLMDEPLASLDLARKKEILPYLEQLRTLLDIPILYVTHSMDEVARLADHVVVLNEGKVVLQGSLSEVFSNIDLPYNFQQDTGVVLQGEVVDRDKQWHLASVKTLLGNIWIPDGDDAMPEKLRIRILAKDVSLSLEDHQDTSILNRLLVEVVQISDDDDKTMSLIRLKSGDEYLIARVTRRSAVHLSLCIGKSLWAQIKSVAIVH